MSRVKTRRRRKSNRISMISVTLVVLMIIGVFSVKTLELQAESGEYKAAETKLEKELDREMDRQDSLQERQKYMQTKKFVEEYAQEKLGLIYPNEIIFKSAD